MGNVLGSGVRTEKFMLGDRAAGLQESYEFKKVIREEHDIEKARKRIEADNRKHDLTALRKDTDAQVKEAAIMVIDSHHLVMHDLKFIDYMMDSLSDSWLKLAHFQGKNLNKEEKKLQQQILKILEDVQSELREGQQRVYSIEAAAKGNIGVALSIKQISRKGPYIIRRVVGRWRARRMGKDLARLHGEHDQVEAAIKKKSEKNAVAHLRNAITYAKDLLKLAYQMFVTDFILLKGMVDLLNEETKEEEEWTKGHSIPASFLALDKEQRKKVMDRLEEELEGERKFGLNYLYQRVDKEREAVRRAA